MGKAVQGILKTSNFKIYICIFQYKILRVKNLLST